MFAIYSNGTMQYLSESINGVVYVTLWVISPALNNSFFEILKVSNLHTVDVDQMQVDQIVYRIQVWAVW